MEKITNNYALLRRYTAYFRQYTRLLLSWFNTNTRVTTNDDNKYSSLQQILHFTASNKHRKDKSNTVLSQHISLDWV